MNEIHTIFNSIIDTFPLSIKVVNMFISVSCFHFSLVLWMSVIADGWGTITIVLMPLMPLSLGNLCYNIILAPGTHIIILSNDI